MTDLPTHFKALRVEEVQDAEALRYQSAVVERNLDELAQGDVLIKVHYSSVNYKDALSASGNKGVTRHFPHTPGIDAAGVVVESSGAEVSVGQSVIVTGYDLGMNTSGGFAEYIRVPAQWIVPLPQGLSLYEAMVLGTAGLTAALCVEKLLTNGLEPGRGEVLVTGATGGVGSIAVALLAKLGFDVTACSGKADSHEFLKSLGATTVINRDELQAQGSRPLLKERWAGAVDVVGGEMLWNVMKSLQYGASVACCGLVGSPNMDATVFPFILRSVNLLGVDSVLVPLNLKAAMWTQLATHWKLEQLPMLGHTIGLDELPHAIGALLQGQGKGRVVLDLGR
ncbi:MAG: YhdH/YhfP family quinone oxidoreductase [Gammaproteobacteria bacterium]